MIKRIANKIKRNIIKIDKSPLRKGKNGTYIFIHINKNGGTSISKAIKLQEEKRHFFVQEVIRLIGEEEFNKAFVFSVVRNPWDRVVSQYKYRFKTNQNYLADDNISFKEWVKLTYKDRDPLYNNNAKMFTTQSYWLKDKNGKIRVNNIMRFELLHEDFVNIAKSIGVENKLPHLNATSKKPYIEYYDKESKEIVTNYFEEDIERFNYSFD